MKKLFFLLLLCTLLFAQEVTLDVKRMDFGTIVDSSMLRHTFHIKNRTDSVVHLEALPNSCSCMVNRPSPDTLQPGQSAELQVVFQPKGYKGKFRWDARIKTDYPASPLLVLPMEAFILVDDVISEEIANFKVFKRGTQQTIEIFMACKDKRDFQIKDIISDVPGMEIVKEEMRKVEFFYPGKQRGYKISITPKVDIPYGRNNGTIQIISDIPGREKIDVRVFAYVIGDITAAPDYLTFNQVEPGKKVTKRIIVSHNKLEHFHILGIRSNSPFFETKIIEKVPHKYYYVDVTLNLPANMKPGEFRDTLYIMTDYPAHKEVVVYVQGIVQAKRKFLKPRP